jgi:hypothetical protein
MAARRERSNSTITQFPGDIRLDEQRDVTPPATISPKELGFKLRKRRYDNQPAQMAANRNIDDGILNVLPRPPPKLNALDSLFVSEESPEPEESAFLPVKRASPWEYYTKAYRRELGGSVVVACKVPATFELFAIKSMIGSDVNEKAQVLRNLQHGNILPCYEIYGLDDAIFTVSECMAISLSDLKGSAIAPSETQIATIVHQVCSACLGPLRFGTKIIRC